MSYRNHIQSINPALLERIDQAQAEINWVRGATGADLLMLATDELGLKALPSDVAEDLSAVEFGNLGRGELVEIFAPHFQPGTNTAADLADQVQLCRAFSNPREVTEKVAELVHASLRNFPRHAGDLRVGSNPGDVLDPFILAANFELLSERSVSKTIEHTASHKILMKIEDLVGHLHEEVLGFMRGNFRVPEPGGTREEGKERLHPVYNPFPGADVGQVPIPERPEAIRLFQVKSKTGSAKGGDGKRLGDQLVVLENTYGADTFYVAIVGNTLRGHRSRGAVAKASPNTAILVGEAAHNELTQSSVGAELLLRTYQRAFRAAGDEAGYSFPDIVALIAEEFEDQAAKEGTDFLSALLHDAVGGPAEEQDSRKQVGRVLRPRRTR